MNFYIIGAGPAGVIAAETLSKHAPGSQIALLGDEAEPPYSRMAIPYFLAGNIGAEGTHLRHAEGHYEGKGISYVQGRAARIDSARKIVILEDGREGAYDKLLLATGASPIRPPIEGLDLPGVHNCWTLQDARNIAALAKPGQPVVLIGAGFIGSIILEALVRTGVSLTVVEMGDRMVPRMMDETAGNMLRNWCEKEKGVRVLTGTGVTKISTVTGAGSDGAAASGNPNGSAADAHSGGGSALPETGGGGFFLSALKAAKEALFGAATKAEALDMAAGSSGGTATVPGQMAAGAATGAAPDAGLRGQGAGAAPLSVTLTSGETLPASLVVVAAGVAPNTGCLEGSGVETDIGVRINEYFQTSVADIYAAGDVAQGRDLSTGEYDMLAIQPVAVEHGRIAALNMAGVATPHRGSLNMNVLDTLGLISSSFGSWMGVEGGQSASRTDEPGYKYLRLEFSGDQLVGVQAVGMTEHVGMARGLIQTGTKLGAWKDRLLESPERLAEAYVARANGL